MPLTAWVVSDGKPGMLNQCLGLAEALGAEIAVKQVRLRAPWRQLSPSILRIGNRWANTPDSDRLAPPWPDVMIATGRHSVASSLWVGSQNPATFRVQIQSPGVGPGNFDLVVVPRHDRLRGPNVMTCKGALHRVTPERLAAEAGAWKERLAWLPHPRIAVIVGGTNAVYRMTPAIAADLGDKLAGLAESAGAGLMVTASRRTGEEAEDILRRRLEGRPVAFWNNRGDNPYFAYLGLADAIVVTCDSVSMTSEAASTGKPVYVAMLDGGSPKFDAFHRALMDDGITRPFAGALEHWCYAPLDDTALAARRVLDEMGRQGSAPESVRGVFLGGNPSHPAG